MEKIISDIHKKINLFNRFEIDKISIKFYNFNMGYSLQKDCFL